MSIEIVRATWKLTAVNSLETGTFSKKFAIPRAAVDTTEAHVTFAYQTVAAVQVLLEPLIEANMKLTGLSWPEGLDESAASGNEYPSTKAVIKCSLLKNNGMSAVRDALNIPAPAAVLFNADGSLDVSNTDLQALLAVIASSVSDPEDGTITAPFMPVSEDQQVTGFIGGYRA